VFINYRLTNSNRTSNGKYLGVDDNHNIILSNENEFDNRSLRYHWYITTDFKTLEEPNSIVYFRKAIQFIQNENGNQ